MEGRGWVAAAFLRIGDMLRTSDDRSMMVEGVASSGQVSTVYNFHVVDYRTYYVGDQAWGFDVWTHNAAHSNEGGGSRAPASTTQPRTNGETAATARGRLAHEQYDPGAGYDTEVTLPSGRRADAVNRNERIVRELKPDNARAIRRGARQVNQYRLELEEMTGEWWDAVVDTY